MINPESVPVPALAGKICQALGIDPLSAIASGSLLMSVGAEEAGKIIHEMQAAGIPCAEIGFVELGEPAVWAVKGQERNLVKRPDRDEIARLFERS